MNIFTPPNAAPLLQNPGLSAPSLRVADAAEGGGPAVEHRSVDRAEAGGRTRLADLGMHLHCSIVGTCMTDADLRKVIRPFVDAQGLSELEVHHEAVRLASQHAQAARALHKALDRRFEPALRRFAKAGSEPALEALWQEFSRRGEVPGAYWAVMSHRHATHALRQRVFGEVHMLSHLMGTSTRADLRQRVFLQAENEQLRQQQAQLQDRYQRLVGTHERADQEHQQTRAQLRTVQQALQALQADMLTPSRPEPAREAVSGQIAWHTQRREQAEQEAARTAQENQGLQDHVAHLRAKLQEVLGELHAADLALRRHLSEADAEVPPVQVLAGQRLLYVGGRPSSTQAIQDWVERQGGELRCHDGGLEDRKGQLTAALAWADRVLFPVDCIDHDSAGRIKRHCTRLGIPFVPLRTASLASFVAAAQVDAVRAVDSPSATPTHLCLRHA